MGRMRKQKIKSVSREGFCNRRNRKETGIAKEGKGEEGREDIIRMGTREGKRIYIRVIDSEKCRESIFIGESKETEIAKEREGKAGRG